MWKFWQATAAAALPEQVKSRLKKEHGLNELAATRLRILEKQGHFFGRRVTFFRVFDPASARAARLELRHYDDVEPRLTLHSGHIEGEGQIVLDREPAEQSR